MPLSSTEVTTIISSVSSTVAMGILALVGRSINHAVRGMRDDVRRFMREHLYLLRVADWSKVNLTHLYDHLNLTPTEPAPLLPSDDGSSK